MEVKRISEHGREVGHEPERACRRREAFARCGTIHHMVESFVCPICDHECKAPDHLREHLHDCHHRSDIVDRYLSDPDAHAGSR